jgi:type IV secretory pathway VirB2 component (pilin)
VPKVTPAAKKPKVTLTVSFRNNTAPGWNLVGTASLTSGGVDPAGDGWLRLTSATGDQAGSAIYNTAFSSSDGVRVTFTYATYGGSGADGISFYLIDGATASPTVGGVGGSLGYSWNKQPGDPNAPGVTNGYVGIGLDEWGNFSATNYGSCTSGCPGRQTNSVTIRGSGSLWGPGGSGSPSEFEYLTRAGASIGTGSRAGAKRARITISAGTTNYITVELDSGSGFQTVINNFNLSTAPGQIALPATLKMGFSSSTGGSTNYHEIRDLSVGGSQPSTTTVVCVPNPSTVGQSVTCTATVSGSAGTPTGTVDFYDGSTFLGTGTLNGSAQATYTTSALTAGTHTINANYSGDGTYGVSSGNTSQVVNLSYPTTTTVTSSVNPSVYGQGVTFTATVTDGAGGTPTGTVTFKDGGTNITGCVNVALNGSGVATCGPLTNLAVGNHAITADYTPSTTTFASSSGSLPTQVVNKADTTTTVTDTPDPTVYGQSYTVNYTVLPVAPGAGTPTGNVTVSDGTNSCTGTVAAGTCTMPAGSTSAPGAKTLTATYGGDTNFNGSSGTTPHTINKADTTTAVTSSLNPSIYGNAVTFTAVVSVVAPGAGTPTGTITFQDGGVNIVGCVGVAVVSNQATCSVSKYTAGGALAIGSHPITAVYSGDTNFNGSTGALPTQVVNTPPWVVGPFTTIVSGPCSGVTLDNLAATGTGVAGEIWIVHYASNPVVGGTPTYNFLPTWFYDVHQDSCTSVHLKFAGAPSGSVAFWWNGSQWVMPSNESGAIDVDVWGTTSPTLGQMTVSAIFGVTNGPPEVPEADTLLLLGGGLGGLATWLGWQYRKVRRKGKPVLSQDEG